MNQKTYNFKKYYILVLIFIFAISIGLLTWNNITLPFSNPWGVTGPLTIIEFNPANNLVRFVFFVSLPAIVLIFIYILNFRGSNSNYFQKNEYKHSFYKVAGSANDKMFIVLFIALAILTSINIPTCCHFIGGPIVDTFHEGESLGPATAFLHGQVPYRDFIIMHGLFENPLRSVLAFSLFGRTIGAARTLQSIIAIIAFVLLVIFIIRFFRFNWVSIFIATIILIALIMRAHITDVNLLTFIPIVIPPRNITAHAFLLIIFGVHIFLNTPQDKINKLRFFVTMFLFSFIPIASFGYSIDRGFYMTATFFVLAPLILLSCFDKYSIRNLAVISILCGGFSGLIILGVFLRGEFWSFFEFVFLIMPRYKELMDGFIYPIERFPFFFVVMLSAINLFWIVYKVLQEFHDSNRNYRVAAEEFTRKYFTELALLMLSIFFFRSALGRSYWAQVAYSSLFPFLLTLIIAIKHFGNGMLTRFASNKVVIRIILVVILILVCFEGMRLFEEDRISEKFPVHVPDFMFIPDNYEPAIRFFRRNLEPKEYFFTMTSEPIWYYFLDRPSPTRFLAVWFGMPYFFQEEMVEDLKQKNVRYILYRSNHWANAIDGFPNTERLQILSSYIHENFRPYITLNDHEIWKKNR